MNDPSARRRSERRSGRRRSEVSPEPGRRAPALVIRLEVGQAPSVVADWYDDAGDEEFTAWLDECPRIANLDECPRIANVAYMAVALAEEAEAA
jgi:hypothetical protein